MGYGTRAMQLLEQYYEGKIPSLTEDDSEDEEKIDTFSGNVCYYLDFPMIVIPKHIYLPNIFPKYLPQCNTYAESLYPVLSVYSSRNNVIFESTALHSYQ